MKKIFFLFLISLSSFAQNTYNIIPKPQKLEVAKGQFKITNTTPIIVPAGDTEVRKIAEQLSTKIKVVWGYENQITETLKPNGLRFINNAAFAEEAYELKVSPQNIEITASNPKGHFYGYQTLLQLLPIEIFGASRISKTILAAPACTVTDEPRFPYRGIMLDVSRHFFPADFIKKLIDNLAVNKINTLHWHLTDDQGWRIEIKKYPKLTEVGSIRKESMVGHYREQKFDGKPYGGFYTQDQIKDIVAYAKSKYVTVIPEIEMPGHAMGALTAYPELGCTGGPYEVRTLWGVEDKVYCPSEKTFSFLEDVLTEVMDLFPSKYIHIGGDECPKDSWKASAFCQDLMKKEGLKDEHELQSYFIRRIDKFVTSKGRRIIGWDEILEGGLSPNATVMSWRGIEGGIEAAKQMHDVIMTPTSYMYLDYYQGNPAKEPLAIGGFLNLEKTYSFEPQVAELNPEQAKYILGVQGNLWTEYVKTPQHAEYMLFPRALAIAEIGWSDKTKNFINFSSRLDTHLKRLELMAVNYSKSANNVSFSTELNTQKRTVVKLSTAHPSGQIRYTLDGSSPIATSLLYNPSTKIKILGDHTLAAAVFDAGGKKISGDNVQTFVIGNSSRKNYTLENQPKRYTGNDPLALTDGIKGNEGSKDQWIGFEGKNLNTVIDLGTKTLFTRLSIAFLSDYHDWVLPPKNFEIWVSNDNKNFESVKKIDLGTAFKTSKAVRQFNVDLGKQNYRYVKVMAENFGPLPAGHYGAGKPSWLMVDEIEIR